MARVGRDQHSRILQMVDGEHRKVADVAAEYGCTPANIYALLNKLRREVCSSAAVVSGPDGPAGEGRSPAAEGSFPSQAMGRTMVPAAPDLFALDPKIEDADVKTPEPGSTPHIAAVPSQEPGTVSSLPTRAVVTKLPAAGVARKAGGLGATLAKPGMALMMRTADGEENLTPFRSLDDLLSAVKPILRAAARSPDAVWFSIQPVDLASLDSDAA